MMIDSAKLLAKPRTKLGPRTLRLLFFRSRLLCIVAAFFFTTACSSGVTKIERYGFKIMGDAPSSWTINALSGSKVVALHPVRLPSYLDTSSIVTETNSQRVLRSRSHVWAGDLALETTRVLSANLSKLLTPHSVLRFPWGQTVEPDYRIRIVFDEMSGERGGEVTLHGQWQVFRSGSDPSQNNQSYSIALKEQSRSDSYDDYVAACNRLMEVLSLTIATELDVLFSQKAL